VTMGGVPRLYVITDRHATGGRPLVRVVEAALSAVSAAVPASELAVQLREKDLEGAALTALAHELRAITAAAGVALYVNDRVDVALAVGADGVHLGGRSLAPADVARIAPALGVAASAHATADLAAAARAPNVRFAVFGPVFETPSKNVYGAPLGLEALRANAVHGVPLLALGGVSPARAPDCLAAGARGVACIRAVMGAPDPARAVCEFFAGFLGSAAVGERKT
jgi:thiamine-phosphate pyrophosphorylase